MDKRSIGLRIQAFRKRLNMSQEQLALKASVARRAVQLLEKGEGNPTLDTIEALAVALKVGSLGLLGGGETMISPAAGGVKEAIQILTRLESLSAVKQAVVLTLIFDDERYIDALKPPRPLVQALRTFSKGLAHSEE